MPIGESTPASSIDGPANSSSSPESYGQTRKRSELPSPLRWLVMAIQFPSGDKDGLVIEGRAVRQLVLVGTIGVSHVQRRGRGADTVHEEHTLLTYYGRGTRAECDVGIVGKAESSSKYSASCGVAGVEPAAKASRETKDQCIFAHFVVSR